MTPNNDACFWTEIGFKAPNALVEDMTLFFQGVGDTEGAVPQAIAMLGMESIRLLCLLRIATPEDRQAFQALYERMVRRVETYNDRN